MKNFQKLVVGVLILTFLFSASAVRPVSASTQNYASLTPDERAELIKIVLVQLDVLRQFLKTLQADDVAETVSPVTSADYTKGSANAEKQIVTFTDFDCPFCHSFHTTLNTLLAKRSDISVTYRHFPLEQLHPNATYLATAAECAGSIGGDSAFWKFVDEMFASREMNEQTNLALIDSFTKAAGLPHSNFLKCLDSQAAEDAVNQDIVDGEQGGVQGTPASFIFVDGVLVEEINGAQPLSAVEDLLNSI